MILKRNDICLFKYECKRNNDDDIPGLILLKILVHKDGVSIVELGVVLKNSSFLIQLKLRVKSIARFTSLPKKWPIRLANFNAIIHQYFSSTMQNSLKILTWLDIHIMLEFNDRQIKSNTNKPIITRKVQFASSTTLYCQSPNLTFPISFAFGP